MTPDLPAELRDLLTALDAAERDARAVVSGLDEVTGGWRERPGSWSVAECLDHLAVANRTYLAAMRRSVQRARDAGWMRRRPARPGFIGGWFVRSLEPPVRPGFKLRAPKAIVPRPSPPLADAMDAFLRSQDDARAFIRDCADLDLAGIRFVNPYVRGIRFSVATGLHVIPAHERRHLWQAWNVRRAAERTASA